MDCLSTGLVRDLQLGARGSIIDLEFFTLSVES